MTRGPVSQALLFGAVRAAEHDLAAFEQSGDPEAREVFLMAVDDVVCLMCEWAEPFVDSGEEIPPVPADLRDRIMHLNATRNRMVGYEPTTRTASH